MPPKSKTSKEVKMNTVKRLILIEASMQKLDSYTGELNEDAIVLHSATQLIHIINKVTK